MKTKERKSVYEIIQDEEEAAEDEKKNEKTKICLMKKYQHDINVVFANFEYLICMRRGAASFSKGSNAISAA